MSVCRRVYKKRVGQKMFLMFIPEKTFSHKYIIKLGLMLSFPSQNDKKIFFRIYMLKKYFLDLRILFQKL